MALNIVVCVNQITEGVSETDYSKQVTISYIDLIRVQS
jgi:hypothetical protein